MNCSKILLVLLFSFFTNISYAQYYDFPFPGWKQTYTSFTWTGIQLEIGSGSYSFDRDTILGNETYVTNGYGFFRSDNGRIYQNLWDWQTQTFNEVLAYDFTLEKGDYFTNHIHNPEDSVKVVIKEKIANMLGDSVWSLHLEYQLNWITKDTIHWLEGVGNMSTGLVKTSFPDGGFTHACTLLEDNRKLSINPENTDYCNCQYVYGVDQDNDGFGNYIPREVNVNLSFHYQNPSIKKNYKVRACDTLRILSDDLEFITLHSDQDCSGTNISIDEYTGLFEFVIYDISPYEKIYLSEQCAWDFAEITVQACFENDCDDNNPDVNPNQIEIAYNGLDDDCNSSTLDDDLDQDDFDLENDCDDNNPAVNPDQLEIAYNGIDDDCNPSTFDDDLDQDGFNEDVDCDDTNFAINPDATEIPNNGIDEDCNGEDLLSGIQDLNRSSFNCFPNPVDRTIYLELKETYDYEIYFYNLIGQLIFRVKNQNLVDVSQFPEGTYFLQLRSSTSDKFAVKKIIVEH